MNVHMKTTFALFVLILCCAQIDEVLGWDYGCYKGLCWADCVTGWCYTRDPYTGNFKTCTSRTECHEDWKCAGVCFVFESQDIRVFLSP